jgi:phosphonate transport system substrate-binding protein
MWRFNTQLLLLCITLLLAACEHKVDDKPLIYSNSPAAGSIPIYSFAVHPLYNPKKLFEAYQPLVDIINRQLTGVQIELEASRDYQVYEQKFRSRSPAFLLPNPWQTLAAKKVGYHVIAIAGDSQDFKGVFIVRKDSDIKSTSDLKGKVVSYPSPTALAAAIMPQFYLYTKGININTEIQNVYVGSQESSIMNAYLGKSAAGVTWPPPWRLFQKEHPNEAAQLKLIWETPPLINNSVMVRDDVPDEIKEKVKTIILNLSKSPQGKAILAGMETSDFYPANDANYDLVTSYIKRFEKLVRPVEIK